LHFYKSKLRANIFKKEEKRVKRPNQQHLFTIAQLKKRTKMPNSSPKCVYIIDSHPITLKGLAALFDEMEEVRYCGGATTSSRAIQDIIHRHPDLLIININFDRSLQGFRMIQILRQRHPHIKILVFTSQDDFSFVQRSLESGAHGFVSQYDSLETLQEAITTVLQGNIYLAKERIDRFLSVISDTPLRRLGGLPTPSRLTNRELEILDLLQQGKKASDIADHLGIHAKTVYAHQKKIRTKLGAENNFDLLRFAIEQNIN
jgi:DNA-binding NarL/FixJ family response regulator